MGKFFGKSLGSYGIELSSASFQFTGNKFYKCFFRITFSEERGHGILTELMEGSLEGHLKDKYSTYKRIRDRLATPEEVAGFMFVPISIMTNWLRKAFRFSIRKFSKNGGGKVRISH